MGLDFGRGAGTPIVAIAGGIVIHKVVDPYKNTNGGNEIRIDHGGGVVSGYKHMQAGSHAHLSLGSIISQGSAVGLVGTTGTATTGNHLHLDFYRDGVRVDPEPYLRGTAESYEDENEMKYFTIVRDNVSGAIYLSNFITRRLIASQSELAWLQGKITGAGGNSTVQDVPPSSLAGYGVLVQ